MTISNTKNNTKLRDWDEVPNAEKIQIYKEIKQNFLKEMEKKEISVKEEQLEQLLSSLS